jgi:hypothetical protein
MRQTWLTLGVIVMPNVNHLPLSRPTAYCLLPTATYATSLNNDASPAS